MRLKGFAADYLHIWMKTPAVGKKEEGGGRREEGENLPIALLDWKGELHHHFLLKNL